MADEIHPETANPAPGELEAVRAFVNTLNLEGHEPEKLARPEDLARWLADHGLTGKRPEAKPADVRRARELREALRALLLANNGHPQADGPLAVVNRAAARAKVGVAFDAHGCRVESAADGVDEGIGNLLAIVARAMTDGSWARLKACGDESCQWAFYDNSKNRSARWCTMAECGNRAKARTFRARQKKSAARNSAA